MSNPLRLPRQSDAVETVSHAWDSLRGCSLSSLLLNRSLLRSSEDHSSASTMSVPVDNLDIFLSHAWCDSGLWKQLALVLLYSPPIAYKAAALSSILGAWFLLGRFPSHVWCRIGVLILSSVIFVICIILFTLYKHRNTMVFLDKCCINQTDLVDKANGISKLSDYLKKSDKLVILWTPNYLNRLWCVYELAVFMQTHETKDVIVVNLGHVRLCVSLLAVQLLGTIAQCPSIRLAGESVQYIIMSCTICGAFVSCMLGASQAHRCLEEWTTFLMKLESFDVNGAECTLYEDHNKLKQLIRKMYRSEADFSALVKRLFLREEEHERSLAWFLSQSSRRIMSAPFVPAIAAGAASAFSLVFLEQSRPLTRIVPEGSVWEMPSTLATLAWAIRTHLLPELLLPFRVQLTLSLTHKLAGQRLGLRSRSLFRIQFTIAFVAFSLLNRASCGLGVFHIPLSEATVKGLSDEVLSLSAGLIALWVVWSISKWINLFRVPTHRS